MKRYIAAALIPMLLSCPVPAFAGTAQNKEIDVKGRYTGSMNDMHTLVFGAGNSLYFPGNQSMTVNAANDLDRGIRLVVTPVWQASAEAYAWIEGNTARAGQSPYAYHLAFYDRDVSVSLDGEAVISLTIPSGYSGEAFYCLDSQGNLTKVRTQQNGNRLLFAVKSGGYYLFLRPLSGSSGDRDSDGSDSGSSASGYLTSDSKKGQVHSVNGIVTGANGIYSNDGRSHWILDSRGWRLRYADGTYASGTAADGKETYQWEKINGSWYVFGSDSYALFGWVFDPAGGWYYCDVNTGMKTGWHEDEQDGCRYYLDPANGIMVTGWRQIQGRWYYFNANTPLQTWEYDRTERIWKYKEDSAGRPYGSMYRNERTPDGYAVDETGAWNGAARRS